MDSSIPALLGGLGIDAKSFRYLALQSLEATRLATEISSKLGVRVPIRLVFESEDLEDFIRRVCELTRESALLPSHLNMLDEAERRQRSNLSFSQDRMAFMHAMTTGSAAYHVGFGLRLRQRGGT
jgi:Phosphopantetheine attachment site